MAVSLVATSPYDAATGGGTSLVLTIPVGAASGDLMVARCGTGANSGTGHGMNEAWTSLIQRVNAGAPEPHRASIFYKIHTGSEVNPTFTCGSANRAGSIQVWRTNGTWQVPTAVSAGSGPSVTTLTADNPLALEVDRFLLGVLVLHGNSDITRPAAGLDYTGVAFTGDTVRAPSEEFRTGSAGGAFAIDCTYRISASGEPSGNPIQTWLPSQAPTCLWMALIDIPPVSGSGGYLRRRNAFEDTEYRRR